MQKPGEKLFLGAAIVALLLSFIRAMAPRTKGARASVTAKHQHDRAHGSWMPFYLQASNLVYLGAAVAAWQRFSGFHVSAAFYMAAFLSSVAYHHRPQNEVLHKLDYLTALMNVSRHFFVVFMAPAWTPLILTASTVCFASLGVLYMDRVRRIPVPIAVDLLFCPVHTRTRRWAFGIACGTSAPGRVASCLQWRERCGRSCGLCQDCVGSASHTQTRVHRALFAVQYTSVALDRGTVITGWCRSPKLTFP